VLRALRNIFNDSDEARGGELGKELAAVLFDDKHREIVRYLSNKNGFDETTLSLELSCGYLICYKMITATDAFHIKKRIIDDAEQYLINHLLQANLKVYNIKDRDRVSSNFKVELNRLNSLYKDVWGSRYKALKTVVEGIYSEIADNTEELETRRGNDTREFILNILQQKITNIQDFLIDYSTF
jgi:hypothetical protein